MASDSRYRSVEGGATYTWKRSSGPVRLRLTRLGMLAAMGLVLVGCGAHPVIWEPSSGDKIVEQGITACTGGYDVELKLAITAEYENLRKGGKLEALAARHAGGAIWKYIKDDKERTKIYHDYTECMKPVIAKLLTEDQRPAVVLVGSTEDYKAYNLAAWAETSVQLLQKRLGTTYKIMPLTVSPAWNDLDFIRAQNPAVIVMHASAFHHEQYKDQAVDKLQAVVKSLYTSLPNARFVIFSRLPKDPTPDLCQRWDRQVKFLRAKQFRKRLVFYPLARQESDFTGAAGIEISQIIRCQSGLDAPEYASLYLREIEKEIQQRIANNPCNVKRR
jgi:hypothetical protein